MITAITNTPAQTASSSSVTKLTSSKTQLILCLFAPLAIVIFISAQILTKGGAVSLFDIIRYSILLVFTHITAVYDFFTKKISNKLILAMLCALAVYCAIYVLFDAQTVLNFLPAAGIGSLITGGLLILVFAISKKGLGGGDVKFMAAAGLYLTTYNALPVMLLGSVAAGLFSLVLLAMRRVNTKSSVPLIPFMYIGMLIAVCFA